MMLSVMKRQYSRITEQAKSAWKHLDSILTTHDRLLFWVFGILHKLALDIMYVWAASPQYAYGGLIYSPNSINYLITTILYLVLFAYIPRKENCSVNFLFHLQFVFILAPMFSFCGLADQSLLFIFAVFLCAMMQIYILRKPASSTQKIHISGIKSYVTVMLGILVLFAVSVPFFYNDFAGLKIFDLDYVYVVREQNSYPIGYEYIQHWTAKVILPFAILLFLEKKKYIPAVICMMIITVIFMQSGHKAFLLLLFPIVFIYLCAKTGHLIKLMYIGLTCAYVAITVFHRMDYVLNHPLGTILCALIPIRALFGPAANKFGYYECFNQYPKIFFSDGKLGNMLGLTYPYKGSSGQVLFSYAGGEFMNSNSCTGYFGDGYAQMGFLGLFLMSLLMVYTVRWIYAYDNPQTHSILSGMFCVFIITLNDAPLFTILFSGGMILSCLLVMIYLSSRTKGDNNGIQRI